MLVYSRNTLISMRNSLKLLNKNSESFHESAHQPLSCHVWEKLSSSNLLISTRGQRGGNHTRCQNIKVVISDKRRQNNFSTAQNGVNYSNLLNIQLGTKEINRGDNQQWLKLCSLNCQSIRNKTAKFVDYTAESKADIFALTETWLSSADDASRVLATPPGFKLIDCPRSDGRLGGGTALLFKESLKVDRVATGSHSSSFEYSEWLIATKSRLRLAIIYRPPYSQNHPVTTSVFIREFAQYLESFVMINDPFIICGDFNIHIDDSQNDYDAKSFIDLLESMCLHQHVTQPTHISGHTLDLLITRKSDLHLIVKPVVDHLFSDHFSIVCDLKELRLQPCKKLLSFRKINSIDMKAFRKDLLATELCLTPPSTLEALIDSYNSSLRFVLGKHAPLKSRWLSVRNRICWMNQEIYDSRKERRKAERNWRTSKSSIDLERFKRIRNHTTYIINNSRRKYYSDLITEHSGDQRKLFKITKSLFKPPCDNPLPPHDDKLDLANRMGDFFIKKIDTIHNKIFDLRATIPSSDADTDSDVAETIAPCGFSTFKYLDNENISGLLSKSSTKTCSLDPIPTKLVKECAQILIPHISSMINLSLQSGLYPAQWKEALVSPLLKKSGLDTSYENYRPVSNLPFVSKLAEKAVANILNEHMLSENIYPIFQSAYRKNHSTETALLRVANDILLNMNKQHVSLLVLLDLSAAFDTVDHTILVHRLQTKLGLSGTALEWFSSYLHERSLRVNIKGTASSKFGLKSGVPQGSCLGPLLFNIYASKLFDIIMAFLPTAYMYADDTQLLLGFKPDSVICQEEALAAMEDCICAIRSWMSNDNLLLNDSKTEFMIIGTKQQLKKINLHSITVGGSAVEKVDSVRNLGAWFNSTMDMSSHISKVCSSAFYYLYNIRKIRKFLSKEVTAILVHSFITNRIDYCNSLLYGVPQIHLSKLQRVQNAAARLVAGAPRFCHITPLLFDLHWLPLRQRILFKILILTYKAIHDLAPEYLKELICLKKQSRYHLRSSNTLLLEQPSGRLLPTLGDRSFKVAAPSCWNVLPDDIRHAESLSSFKSLLKTHLFNLAFN